MCFIITTDISEEYTMHNIFTKQAKEDGGELGWRHLLPSAQLADLAGMSEKDQVGANYGALKDMIGGAPTAVVTAATDAFIPGAGRVLDTVTGPLTHKMTKAIFDDGQKKNKTGLRHFFGPARALSYAGATPEQQVQANWDSLKLHGGSLIGAGLGGALSHVLSKGSSDSDYARNMVLALLGGGLAGRTATFLGLRAKRRYDRGKKEEDKEKKERKQKMHKKASQGANFSAILGDLVNGKESPAAIPEDPNLLYRLVASEERLRELAKKKAELLFANANINKRNELRKYFGKDKAMMFGLGGAALGGLMNENPLAGAVIGGAMGAGGVGGANMAINLHKNLGLEKHNISPRLAAIAGGLLGSLGSGAVADKAMDMLSGN